MRLASRAARASLTSTQQFAGRVLIGGAHDLLRLDRAYGSGKGAGLTDEALALHERTIELARKLGRPSDEKLAREAYQSLRSRPGPAPAKA